MRASDLRPPAPQLVRLLLRLYSLLQNVPDTLFLFWGGAAHVYSPHRVSVQSGPGSHSLRAEASTAYGLRARHSTRSTGPKGSTLQPSGPSDLSASRTALAALPPASWLPRSVLPLGARGGRAGAPPPVGQGHGTQSLTLYARQVPDAGRARAQGQGEQSAHAYEKMDHACYYFS